MTDYIFEIQCYEKSNLIKEFTESCGYKLGLYYFYDDHVVVDFIKPEEENLLIQQPISFELYAFTVKPGITNKALHNKTTTKLIKSNWRAFLSSKFPNYNNDLENWLHGDYVL